MNKNEKHLTDEELSRRKMLGVIVGVINLGLIGAVGGPVVGFATAPLGIKRTEKWVKLMDESMIQPGEVKEVTYSLLVKDGYHDVERKYTAFLRRSDDGVICLDPACTHLGCKIKYQSAAHKFVCPCHGGVFKEDGTVESGPPPKALEQHPVKIEAGKIWIMREV